MANGNDSWEWKGDWDNTPLMMKCMVILCVLILMACANAMGWNGVLWWKWGWKWMVWDVMVTVVDGCLIVCDSVFMSEWWLWCWCMEWSTQFAGRTACRMGITLIPKGAVLLNSQHPILFNRTTIWMITPLHHLGCPHQTLEFNTTARDKVLGIKQTKANNTIRLLPMRLDPKVLRSPSLLPLISLDICRRMHSVS